MVSFENPLQAAKDARNKLDEAGIEILMYQYPTGENEFVIDTTKHDEEVLRKFAEWLETLSYTKNGPISSDVYIPDLIYDYKKSKGSEGRTNDTLS